MKLAIALLTPVNKHAAEAVKQFGPEGAAIVTADYWGTVLLIIEDRMPTRAHDPRRVELQRRADRALRNLRMAQRALETLRLVRPKEAK